MEATGFRFFPTGAGMAEVVPPLLPRLMALSAEQGDHRVVGNIVGGGTVRVMFRWHGQGGVRYSVHE